MKISKKIFAGAICVACIPLYVIFCGSHKSSDDKKLNETYLANADRIVKTALADEKGYKILREMTGMGHRLCGSEGSMKVIKWAEQQMKYLGFDKVWLQPVEVPHWERGAVEKAEIVSSKKHKGRNLSICALGRSIGTDPRGVTGMILKVQSFEELHEKAEQAKGKIIFFNRPFEKTMINTFGAYGGAVGQRGQGAVEAAKVGGVAAIVRSVTSKYDNVPHTGAMGYKDGVKKVPSACIGQIDADFLSQAIKNEPGLKVNLKLSCENLPRTQSYNVIGELTGTEFPDEVIVVGGHIDAWDKGEGAHDDGAGCVQSLEALDLFKRLNIKPKRTIRCVLFINEEMGLDGGIAYGAYAGTAAEKHIAAIESDRGGFTPRGFGASVKNQTSLEKMQGWLPYLKKALIEWVRNGGGGADISRIRNAEALIGYVPDAQRYFDFHHSANDVFEAVNPRELELGSAAMAILVYLLSEEGL